MKLSEASSPPMGPVSHSTMHRAGPWVGCINIFDIRKSCAKNEYYELPRYPDTYDFARGLALGCHFSSSLSVSVEQSGGRVFPFLDPTASSKRAAFLFFSPPAGGGEVSSSSSSSSREEGASGPSNEESDTS